MTKPRFFLSFLLSAALLAACAPTASTAAPPKSVMEPSLTSGSAPTVEARPSVELAATSTPAAISATPASDVQPVATSRGPNLEATDPTTVNLASGGLQLVEIFRFT